MPTALAPGDLFEIPIGASERAIGRVMQVKSGVGFLIEVFNGASTEAAALEPSGRMFRPCYVSTPSYEKAGWTLLHRDAAYDGGDWNEIGFVLGREGDRVRISRGAETELVPEADAAGMEEMIVNTVGRIVYRVRERYGLLEPDV